MTIQEFVEMKRERLIGHNLDNVYTMAYPDIARIHKGKMDSVYHSEMLQHCKNVTFNNINLDNQYNDLVMAWSTCELWQEYVDEELNIKE